MSCCAPLAPHARRAWQPTQLLSRARAYLLDGQPPCPTPSNRLTAPAVTQALELRRELASASAAAEPSVVQLKQLMLDPAVAREFARLRAELEAAQVRGRGGGVRA